MRLRRRAMPSPAAVVALFVLGLVGCSGSGVSSPAATTVERAPYPFRERLLPLLVGVVGTNCGLGDTRFGDVVFDADGDLHAGTLHDGPGALLARATTLTVARSFAAGVATEALLAVKEGTANPVMVQLSRGPNSPGEAPMLLTQGATTAVCTQGDLLTRLLGVDVDGAFAEALAGSAGEVRCSDRGAKAVSRPWSFAGGAATIGTESVSLTAGFRRSTIVVSGLGAEFAYVFDDGRTLDIDLAENGAARRVALLGADKYGTICTDV